MIGLVGGVAATQVLVVVVGAVLTVLLTVIAQRVGNLTATRNALEKAAIAERQAIEQRRVEETTALRASVIEVSKALLGEPATPLLPKRTGLVEQFNEHGKKLDEIRLDVAAFSGRYLTADGVVIRDITDRLLKVETWQSEAEQWRIDAERYVARYGPHRDTTPSD